MDVEDQLEKAHLSVSVPHSPPHLVQFHHLPGPFHRKQEELKFTTALSRLQHRVRETRILRESLQQGTKTAQGGVQGLEDRGFGVGFKSDLFVDLCLERCFLHP